jgi:hypothetical protein
MPFHSRLENSTFWSTGLTAIHIPILRGICPCLFFLGRRSLSLFFLGHSGVVIKAAWSLALCVFGVMEALLARINRFGRPRRQTNRTESSAAHGHARGLPLLFPGLSESPAAPNRKPILITVTGNCTEPCSEPPRTNGDSPFGSRSGSTAGERNPEHGGIDQDPLCGLPGDHGHLDVDVQLDRHLRHLTLRAR